MSSIGEATVNGAQQTAALPNLHMLDVRASVERRESAWATRAVLAVAATSICLLQVPRAFGGSVPLWTVASSLAPIVIAIAVLAPAWASRARPRYLSVAILVFALLTVVSLFRSAYLGVVGTLSTATYASTALLLCASFGLLLFRPGLTRSEFAQRATAVALAPGIFVALNAALEFGLPGVNTIGGGDLEPSSPAQLLGFLGVNVARVSFPLGEGINSFGIIAAAGLVGSALVALGPGRRSLKGSAACISVISFGCILLTDSRASLVFAAAAIFVAHLLLSPSRRGKGIALALPVVVVIALILFGILSSGSLSDSLSRQSGGGDLLTATNRTYIWGEVLNELSDPRPAQLIGFGAGGQIESGVAVRYAYLFSYLPDPTQHTAHNVVLQTILDIGYLGLTALITLMLGAGKWLIRGTVRSTKGAAGLTGILLLLALNGITEGFPSTYAPETLFTLLLVASAAAGLSTVGEPETDGAIRVPAKELPRS